MKFLKFIKFGKFIKFIKFGKFGKKNVPKPESQGLGINFGNEDIFWKFVRGLHADDTD